MVEVKNLTKILKEEVVIDKLDYKFEKGQIYGIVGGNISGKSVLMDILAGYVDTTDGSVIICGHDIEKEPVAAKTSIGYLPEKAPLYESMKVREYLSFVAELKHVQKDECSKEIDRVIKITGLSDVDNKVIRYLSQGYKQCVGLAQALIGNPEIILLDEPTNGLDPKQIADVRKIIKNITVEDHVIIISSHLLGEINAICDRVLVIKNGKIVVDDTTENLKKTVDGSNEIVLSIVGKPDKAVTVIKKIEGVKKVESRGKDEDGHSIIKVTVSHEYDIRESISKYLSDKKVVVTSMTLNELSPEDIYNKMTDTSETNDIDSE